MSLRCDGCASDQLPELFKALFIHIAACRFRCAAKPHQPLDVHPIDRAVFRALAFICLHPVTIGGFASKRIRNQFFYLRLSYFIVIY